MTRKSSSVIASPPIGVGPIERVPSFPSTEEPNPWVSAYSRWRDPKWEFERVSAGGERNAMLSWDFLLPDGGHLLDEERAALLEELRRLALSCFVDPRGYRYKTTSASHIGQSLRWLAKWMIERHYYHLGQLDPEAFGEHIEDVLSQFKGSEDEEADNLTESILNEDAQEALGIEAELKLPFSYLWVRLRGWHLLWQQRMALEDMGVAVCSEPFHEKSVGKVCVDLAPVAIRRIPPVPDEVAIVVLNTAHRFVNLVAEDLIEFSRIAAPVYAAVNVGDHHDERPQAAIQEWVSQKGGLGWLAKFEGDGEGARREVPLPVRLAGYMADLMGAGATILQAEVGLRIGELCSVTCGWDPQTDLPSCIEVKSSASGALDLYYLRAVFSKTRRVPQEERWLVGAKLKGSPELPDAVRVVVMLHQLLEPWRNDQDNEEDRRLLAIFSEWRRGFPRGGRPSLRRFRSSVSLLRRCRRFIRRHVDLSRLPDLPTLREYKESQGACISSYQWRKTYARFVYQVDGRLLPAIARQFKHVSLAMTESAYVGADISVFHEVADHNRGQAVELFLEYARGKPVAREGRLAKAMERFQAELAQLIAGKRPHEAYLAIDRWACARDLSMFFHGYGGCIPGLAVTEAECHKRAGTVHWANREPNYQHRGPSLCTGCFLFIAGPETVDYWTTRFVENMEAWVGAKRIGREAEFRVQFERAQQSEKYLKTLGATVPSLETA